jgi:hypothetical protein
LLTVRTADAEFTARHRIVMPMVLRDIGISLIKSHRDNLNHYFSISNIAVPN